MYERLANRGQSSLFEDLAETPTAPDGKTQEAAELFLSATARGDRTITASIRSPMLQSGNVEQLLSTGARFVDRMIYRAELDRDKTIAPKEQEDILRRSADEYHDALEEKHRHGSAIRQFVDNFGLFCEHVTYRLNAPIAPGVNGFGLTRQQLARAVALDANSQDARIFREVITSAVAGNVLSVRVTKQGQAGTEKIVFYLNRLLCVKFQLPLNYGGWQHLPIDLITRMMQEAVPRQEMTRKGSSPAAFF